MNLSLSAKALLPVFPCGNEQHTLQSCPFLIEEKQKSGKRILYDTSLNSLLFFKSGSAEDCGLLSGNSLAMSILHEIVKSGSITFIVELRSSNICKVSLGLSFESLSSCHSAFLISFLLEWLFGLL